ncbi:MAG: carboxymuconolactone decarboxylase family protein [Spirochaetales bacterium]|nr:carboxymuconolactone decarboxylase family protein [Spirochaetales bacterium]
MPENPLAALMKLDPKLEAHLKECDEFAYSEGALPKKIKYLIAMAFDAAHGAVGGVRAPARNAMREGATKEEIIETLRAAGRLGGAGGFFIASQGLEDVFE